MFCSSLKVRTTAVIRVRLSFFMAVVFTPCRSKSLIPSRNTSSTVIASTQAGRIRSEGVALGEELLPAGRAVERL